MSKIVVCNDYVCGVNGEEVLWNFLCDRLPNAIGIDSRTVKTNNINPQLHTLIKKHIDRCGFNADIKCIIQNATFISIIDPKRFTITYLQDDLRKMGRQGSQLLQQSLNLKNSQIRVCNSRITARSYPEYKFEIIPIGVNDVLFAPSLDRKADLRKSMGVLDIGKVGIFVGALNEVKGWSDIEAVIRKRSDIFFIVVSKYDDGKCSAPNSITFNRIDQPTLAKLLGCADFFILGSKVETQCLAAIEACLCGLPVIMKPTGIFMDFSPADRDKCGIFDADGSSEILSKNIDLMYLKYDSYRPRQIMLDNDLSIDGMITKWKALLANI
jgi:glycosyltransferase involved in cell wall biosynthesis